MGRPGHSPGNSSVPSLLSNPPHCCLFLSKQYPTVSKTVSSFLAELIFFSEINTARYYQTERDRGKKTELLYQLYNQNLVAPHNSHCQIISHSVVWSLTLKLAALEKSVTFLFGLAGFSICRIWVSLSKRATSWGKDGHFVVAVLSFLFVFHLLSFFPTFLSFSLPIRV